MNNSLNTEQLNLALMAPELFLLVASCAILLIDMYLRDGKRYITYYLTLGVLAIAGMLSWNSWQSGQTGYLFNHMFVVDPMSDLLKMFSYLAVGVTLVYSRRYSYYRGMLGDTLGGEFYVLTLFALLGQMVMISASNFLSLYLGLELMSLCLYALVALRRDAPVSTEASMKYFILGALASGFLLYGISMMYGATGTLNLSEVAQVAASPTANRIVLVFGIVFLVAGLAFKLGAVPFHMWVPDVYQGAPTSVTLVLGGAPKLAAFAICVRLLIEGMSPLAVDWQHMLLILAVLSLAIGNLAAIAQSNIKRMLAYSTISQMGFMLLGLASGVLEGKENSWNSMAGPYSSAMFYVISYVLATLGTFGMVLLLSRTGFEADNLDDFKGLNQRSPWFAFVMLLLMFSLAGIPPLVGFYAKFSILAAVVNAHGMWLAVFAVLASLIGAFYYLRVVKVMYFDKPLDNNPIVSHVDMRVLLSLNGLAILVLGLMPNRLMSACLDAVVKTLST
ncbi:NADH-quinone oxidoreductase subunit NuoN [Massilia sp. W12]|uniref:NADH-quinone oxidoreductase subunit NuoN n=1 Tax=Massilia sp. W12 TaxID=3126507 RepID=UPI0030CE8FB7